jgi:Ftsk gamma domain
MLMEFREVRERIGGIKGVVRALDGACVDGNRVLQCPFCGAKRGKAGFFTHEGVDFFKCHAKDCSSRNEAMTEVGYIACREGLSDTKPPEGGASPAYERLLKLANCWEEPKEKKSAEEELPEDLVAAAKRLVISRQSASLRLLQENLKIGPPRAIAVLNELERMGVVGPPKVKAPREILIKNLPSETGGVPAEPGARDGGAPPSEQILCEAIELMRMLPAETKVVAARFEKHLKLTPEKAAELMGTLRSRGWLDEADLPKKLPDKPVGLMVVKLGEEISFEWSAGKPKAAPEAAPRPAAQVEGEKEKLRPGLRALRAFFDRLPPTDVQMMPFIPGESLPDPIPNAVLRKVKFKPVSLYEKRGLTPWTCNELAFRGNPRSNEALLREMYEEFGAEEMLAAGLYLDGDRKRKLERRPNTQFCGKGQVGRKPEAERRDEDDKWQWGWCEPLLIPYFDSLGQLVKLRPHKGGAKASTIAGEEHIYVPRRHKAAGDIVEKFAEVVICEGEFKAAAIWQTIGSGAVVDGALELDGEPPVGVCALPGISFAKSPDMREELEEWLREVECKKVYVAFDAEDNRHKPLRQRFDAQIYARYLAEDLHRKLHLAALVVTLPDEWQNAKGKADWDGALAKLVQAEAVLDAAPAADEPPPEVADQAADEWDNPE